MCHPVHFEILHVELASGQTTCYWCTKDTFVQEIYRIKVELDSALPSGINAVQDSALS